MYEVQDSVERALENLLEACREEVREEEKISIAVHERLQKSYAEAAALVRELEQQVEELQRRNSGMLNHLTRIRTKADMASGFIPGDVDDCALQGRAAGAEGAVDRLIAMFAGKVYMEKENE